MALLLAISFLNGLSKSFIDSAINTEYSHIQIHHPEYEIDNKPFYTIRNLDSLLTFLDSNTKISDYTLRTKIEGLASSSQSSRGIKIIGIDPDCEAKVTGINNLIVEGEFFTNISKRPIVIGEKLAEHLGLKVKSKILLTFINANNDLTAESFRVSAILGTNSERLNESYVFIKKDDFYQAFSESDITHEIAIKLNNITDADTVSYEIKKFTAANHVETWKEIAPEIETSINQTRVDKVTLLIVIIVAFSFGLINTMLMQVSERTREIGMLIANGMSRYKVFLMIIFESIFSITLALLSGTLLGYLMVTYFNHHGLDFTNLAEGFSSQGWSKIIYPVLYPVDYINVLECSLLSGFIGAALPAYRAIKLNVIAALRKV